MTARGAPLLRTARRALPRLLFVVALAVACDAPARRIVRARPGPVGSDNLQALLTRHDGSPVTIELAAGRHVLLAARHVEARCGNCEDPATPVHATVGLVVTGRGIRIVGPRTGEAIVETRAGYGILFRNCDGCSLEGVTVTGGERDSDGRATDAAVVVERSRVTIADCVLRDNVGDPVVVKATVVGVAGIAGREGADLRIERCRILRNSWDGIALYRGARAEIRDTIVDGVDAARGDRVGGGRGVGIGLTWDARATVEGCLVRRTWKGIGIFVDAEAVVRRNVVEDVLTWGISVWDAGKGSPRAEISENVVFGTGACGAAITIDPSRARAEPGGFRDNLLVATGSNPRYDSGEPYCFQRALAEHAVPAGFVVEDNVFADNREPGGAPGAKDEPLAGALARARPWLCGMATSSVLREARFFRESPAQP